MQGISVFLKVLATKILSFPSFKNTIAASKKNKKSSRLGLIFCFVS